MRTDEQTDVRKLIVAFRNFAKAPKNDTQRCCNARYACRPTAYSCCCHMAGAASYNAQGAGRITSQLLDVWYA